MKDLDKLTRRDFTVKSALAILSGVPITLAACGDGNSSPSPTMPTAPAPTPPAASDVEGVVGTNHGHTAVITAAQLNAGNALTLDITGTSNHPHTVELSAAEIDQIAAGNRVQKTSSSDAGHTHSVTFN